MMSLFGDLRHTPAATSPPGATTSMGGSDPLQNLSTVQSRMDTLHRFLSDSVNRNTVIGKDQMEMVSAEISAAIHQIIVNGAALLACSQTQNCPQSFPPINQQQNTNRDILENPTRVRETSFPLNPKAEDIKGIEEDYELIEIDAVELLAEHIHFCEICGKGFKRDANLRMHMRAHGNQFKTPEALAKPEAEKCVESKGGRRTRFSCPFVGCNRNKQHKKFRPLKSVICVKNHFKRSHCPKMYTCTRCNRKSFSVVADLKSHLKHCGETKWKCSCGTSFSRKDKLFGHMALFEGHMPAVAVEEEVEKGREAAAMVEEEEEEEDNNTTLEDVEMGGKRRSSENGGLFEGLLDGFGSIDSYCFQDMLDFPNGNGLASGMDSFFNY